MCEMCTYTITCRVCGGTYKQMGSMDDSDPCGPCTKWARKIIAKAIFRPGFLLPPEMVNFNTLLSVRVKPKTAGAAA
jgi:hypothetical protein